tara:strand:- start:37960 stop:39033 length:1074 start_codon:yes stop_codon:yes gene_type:complete
MSHSHFEVEFTGDIALQVDEEYRLHRVPDSPSADELAEMWDADPKLLRILEETEDAYAEREYELAKEELTPEEYDALEREAYDQLDDVNQGTDIKQRHTLTDLLELDLSGEVLALRELPEDRTQPTSYDEHLSAAIRRADRIRWGTRRDKQQKGVNITSTPAYVGPHPDLDKVTDSLTSDAFFDFMVTSAKHAKHDVPNWRLAQSGNILVKRLYESDTIPTPNLMDALEHAVYSLTGTDQEETADRIRDYMDGVADHVHLNSLPGSYKARETRREKRWTPQNIDPAQYSSSKRPEPNSNNQRKGQTTSSSNGSYLNQPPLPRANGHHNGSVNFTGGTQQSGQVIYTAPKPEVILRRK